MHELSITQSMIEIVLEQAEKAGARKIKTINLVIGELSGFVEESVKFYFGFLSKDTIAEGAELNFVPVAAQGRCRLCDIRFELEEFNWNCPRCGVSDIDITAGRELFVESINIE